MARQRIVWAALAIVYVVWGSTYLAIRYLVETVPPYLGAGLRFTFAGLVLAGILAARSGPRRLLVAWRELAAVTFIGVLLLVAGNASVMLAERSIDSHLAALIVASVPLFVVVLRLAARERPARATLAGVLIGFAGLAVLVQPGSGSLSGVLIVLGGSLAWSVGSFLSSRLPLPRDPLVSTAYEMATAGVLLLVVSAARGEIGRFAPGAVSTASWVALAYLIVFGSLLAFTAYVWLLQAAPLSLVSTYAYVNPAVAVALGAATGESLSGRTAIGGAIVIAAVAVVVTAESRLRQRAAVSGARPAAPPREELTPSRPGETCGADR